MSSPRRSSRNGRGANDVGRVDVAPAITRRAAVARVGMALAVGPALLTAGCSAWSSATSGLDSEAHALEHGDWHDLVGERFQLEGSPFHEHESAKQADTVFILKEVIDERIEDDVHRPPLARNGAISLLFVTESREHLPNATYTVRHAELGRFHLFLHEIPRADHPDERIYEAVLN